jgi:hypothetical protein
MLVGPCARVMAGLLRAWDLERCLRWPGIAVQFPVVPCTAIAGCSGLRAAAWITSARSQIASLALKFPALLLLLLLLMMMMLLLLLLLLLLLQANFYWRTQQRWPCLPIAACCAGSSTASL